MTPDDLKKLKELAQAAPPGPWKSDYCGDVWTESPDVPLDSSQPEIGPLFRAIGSTPKGPDNGDAAFIAAANPQTVTKLVEEVERLREALEWVAQWDGDKESIAPRITLKIYAKMARAALNKGEDGTPKPN